MSFSRRSANVNTLSMTCQCASRQPRQNLLKSRSGLHRAFVVHRPSYTRGFSLSALRATDGVFRELTSARVPTPWIEAFRRKEAGLVGDEVVSDTAAAKEKRLEGKRMSESYHSVVLPLARDPWLGDTYLNSSGHIRYSTLFSDLSVGEVSGRNHLS
jgi:hypothetical protein